MLPGCVHVALLLEGAKATVPSTFHSSWRAQVHYLVPAIITAAMRSREPDRQSGEGTLTGLCSLTLEMTLPRPCPTPPQPVLPLPSPGQQEVPHLGVVSGQGKTTGHLLSWPPGANTPGVPAAVCTQVGGDPSVMRDDTVDSVPTLAGLVLIMGL